MTDVFRCLSSFYSDHQRVSNGVFDEKMYKFSSGTDKCRRRTPTDESGYDVDQDQESEVFDFRQVFSPFLLLRFKYLS